MHRFTLITLTAAIWAGFVGFSAAQAQAPAQTTLRCVAKENGADAEASIEVIREDGVRATQGRCEGTIRLPQGHYHVRVLLDGAADRPVIEQDVELHTRRSADVLAEFSTGTLEVRTTRQGRRAPSLVTLERNGQRVASFAGGVAVHVSAGTYVAIVKYGSEERRVDVTVAPNAPQTLNLEF